MDIAQKFNFNNLTGYKIDVNLLREFESCLDPLAPEDCSVPCRVLGYGEISTVFEIQAAGMDGLAFKRMSIFETQDELDDYLGTYLEYNHMLEEDIGVQLPAHGHACLDSPSGRPIFYIIQEKVRTPSIGNKAIHLLPESETMELIYCVLLELLKVWQYSCREENCQVGIDGQISNWVVTDFDPSDPILTSDASLMYVDTSTPMLRIDGEEQLDAELLLRSAPSFPGLDPAPAFRPGRAGSLLRLSIRSHRPAGEFLQGAVARANPGSDRGLQ